MHIYQSYFDVLVQIKYKIFNLIVVPLRSYHSQNVLLYLQSYFYIIQVIFEFFPTIKLKNNEIAYLLCSRSALITRIKLFDFVSTSSSVCFFYMVLKDLMLGTKMTTGFLRRIFFKLKKYVCMYTGRNNHNLNCESLSF